MIFPNKTVSGKCWEALRDPLSEMLFLARVPRETNVEQPRSHDCNAMIADDVEELKTLASLVLNVQIYATFRVKLVQQLFNTCVL